MVGRWSLEHHVRCAAVRVRQGSLGTAARNRIPTERGRPRFLLPHPAANPERAAGRRLNRLRPHLAAPIRSPETGVDRGITFETIEAGHRTGLEPRPRFEQTRIPAAAELSFGTSDEFFAHFGDRSPFHLVFADGPGDYRQTYRDVINSFRHLERRGQVLEKYASCTSDDTLAIGIPDSFCPTVEDDPISEAVAAIEVR